VYRSKNRLGGKASTLGVIVDWLGDPYQATVCDGIEQGASHAGANLLIFVGGALPAQPGAVVARHQVYQLAGRHNLDGLVVLSSTLSHEVGPAAVQAFCRQFVGLPVCSVGLPLDQMPSVTIDNEAGMSAVLRHLLEQHRARRIAFISGPAVNAESQIRERAYHTLLEQHGIPAEEHCVFTGTFMMDSGAQAVRSLAKRFGARLEQLDAIVAANDNMAIGAMDELTRMGVSVPDAIAVVGFDDIEEARLTEPSLTTARQPLTRIGTEAVRRVLQEAGKGEGELDLRSISTELVVRHSCGCSALGLRSRSPSVNKQRFQLALMGQRERILAQLGRAARGRFSAAGADWEQLIVNALVEDLVAGESGRFLPAAERLVQRLGARGVDLNAVDEVLSALREEMVPLLMSEPDKHRHAEDLFHAVRLSTSAALQRGAGRAHLTLSRWARTIAVVCNALAAAVDYADLGARLRRHLPKLGLRSCFVSVYEPGGDASQARLIASCDASGAAASCEGRTFRARELLPPELANADGEGRSFAVLPLTGLSEVIGHVLFEYTAQHAFACGALAEAMSISIRNAMAGAAAP
jgi:DNA-binding LacI/PurR family transcriptional regulator